MARLPQPGSDHGTWGDVLNDFLSQALATNGQLKPDSVGTSQLKDNAVTASTIAPNSITTAALASNAVTAAIIADGTITETLLDSALQAKINAAASGSPVTSVNTKTGVVTLNKADIGLGNVDNTSDADKPVSTATQAALDGKLDKQTTTSTTAVYTVSNDGTQSVRQAASGSASASTFVIRDGAGAIVTGAPTTASHATTKSYVDAADATKANDSAVVHNSGNESVSGQKTFRNHVFVGDGTASVDMVTRGIGYNGFRSEVYSDTASPYSMYTRFKGTFASPTQVPSGSYLGQFGFRGANETGAANVQDAVRIGAWTEEDVKSTSQKSALIVWTAPGHQISPIERFRISGSGNVTIGYPGDNGSLFSVGRNSGYSRNGTVETNGTTLTGTGTLFTNTFRVGDTITVTGESSRTVTAIASDTSLTVNAPFSNTASDLAYTLTSNPNLFRVQANGNIGINQANPQARLHFGAGTAAVDGIQFGSDTTLYRSAADTLKTDDNLIVGAPGSAAGSVVTVDGAQTLTNKTLSGPSFSGTVTLPQSSTFHIYNTADQTTNYERLTTDFASNTARIYTAFGGTAASRNISLGVVATANTAAVTTNLTVSAGAPFFRFNRSSSTTNAPFADFGGLNTSASSGMATVLSINPVINQSSTAGYTALLVNPTETSTGSGTKLLADFQVGGSSKFKIDSSGVVTVAAAGTSSGSLATVDGAQTLTNKTIDGANNTLSNVPVSALGTGKVTGSSNGTATNLTLWTGTAAQYAAIASKDPNTVYVVTA